MGGWGEAELFKGFGEQRQTTFREPMKSFSGIWGDQSVIVREQGRTKVGMGLIDLKTRHCISDDPF